MAFKRALTIHQHVNERDWHRMEWRKTSVNCLDDDNVFYIRYPSSFEWGGWVGRFPIQFIWIRIGADV